MVPEWRFNFRNIVVHTKRAEGQQFANPICHSNPGSFLDAVGQSLSDDIWTTFKFGQHSAPPGSMRLMSVNDIRFSRSRPVTIQLDVREAIEKAGARLLFLPPYSPDFNPIEMAFSKLKALLRKAAARAIDELWSVIADCLRAFKSDECRNYFEAAGYDPE